MTMLILKGNGENVRANQMMKIIAGGIISVTLLKSVFFPTKRLAGWIGQKLKEASTTELQAVENIGKNIPK